MSDNVTTVLDFDRSRREAMMNADVGTLSEMFADDLVWIHATSRVDTKKGLFEAIGTV